MAVKKLYTENYIRNIANSLRQVVGDPSARYNTQEMAATLATIHRGAKDVWIGTQFAYNQIPASQIDVEICYIILESGQVIRCYAGSTIIYDVPIVWDYVLPTTVMTARQEITPTIDGNPIIIAKESNELVLADAWEWYIDAEFGPGLFNQSQTSPFTNLVFNPRWQNYSIWYMISRRGRGISGIDSSLIPAPDPSDTVIPLRLHATKNVNEGIYLYWINDDNSEIFLGSSSAFDTYPSNDAININNEAGNTIGNYTINEFKFRWKT